MDPKASGGYRPILNVRPLNRLLKVQHFKMKSLQSTRNFSNLELGGLNRPYRCLPSYSSPQNTHKVSSFCVAGQAFEFVALPFGLATVPSTFTKVLTPVLAYLRKQHVHILGYLEDWLIRGSSFPEVTRRVRQTMCLIQWLGFLPNLEKSELMPRAELTFLGTSFNLRKGTASPSPERINKVVRLSKLLMGCTTVKVHLYLQLLRLMASCIAISPWERLRMRPLQLHLLVHWNAASINMEERIPITKQVFSHYSGEPQKKTSPEALR